MVTGNMRRAQLVSPFGVGAMSVSVDGTSVITAGLDYWYPDNGNLSIDEFEVHDWRLARRLNVSAFRLPPDYRSPNDNNSMTNETEIRRNINLRIPALIFPLWYFCPYCKRLKKSNSIRRDKITCDNPEHINEKKPPRMSPVPFVVICPRGHISDFPFKEWVHRSTNPQCPGSILKLESHGGGSLEGQEVVCKDCGKHRSLQGIMNAHFDNGNNAESTNLSNQLSKDEEQYLCRGSEPWLEQASGHCGQPVRGALRAAGNVYFPKIESSIYLPQGNDVIDTDLQALFKRFSYGITMLHNLESEKQLEQEKVVSFIRKLNNQLFSPYSDQQLFMTYQDQFTIADSESSIEKSSSDNESLAGSEEWRLPEFQMIRETPSDPLLTGVDPTLHPSLNPYLDRVRQITTLQETRALWGFTRVRDGQITLGEGKALLRRHHDKSPQNDWLPAYVVKGEGIYLELNQERLQNWEKQEDVIARAGLITSRYNEAATRKGMPEREFTPRFVLLHTLSHILINQLIFDCGYTSASLRERLYASTTQDKEMAGLLIYTAAGDSEGTLGGLVRMAEPKRLADVFNKAISSAKWCSTDPVCMDSGEKGQGPDSCNLAACHGCALLPETSCEEFNRFLDRGLLIGTFEDSELGYFSDF
ncbi:hypothetical protein KIM372_01200 [Bombiscardovia nodaiensis]|uniref:MrfA-like Zn-binding domain-containing protein n=1 Tax=Bombiscardovia nodaiensis TaxID=2932181 RepID=A0ABM8B5T2_9BIFI|nr:hypothetical protein KIM372_01200 [Bombiscardovia nodaiensis]